MYLIHDFRRPDCCRTAHSSDDSGGTCHRHKVAGKAVQPRQEQANLGHPAAVVLAMVDRVDDLPVAVKGDDHHASYASV